MEALLSSGNASTSSSDSRLSSEGSSSLPLLESPAPTFKRVVSYRNISSTASTTVLPVDFTISFLRVGDEMDPRFVATKVLLTLLFSSRLFGVSTIFSNIASFINSLGRCMFSYARIHLQRSCPRDASISLVK